jgi:hypothetical protein
MSQCFAPEDIGDNNRTFGITVSENLHYVIERDVERLPVVHRGTAEQDACCLVSGWLKDSEHRHERGGRSNSGCARAREHGCDASVRGDRPVSTYARRRRCGLLRGRRPSSPSTTASISRSSMISGPMKIGRGLSGWRQGSQGDLPRPGRPLAPGRLRGSTLRPLRAGRGSRLIPDSRPKKSGGGSRSPRARMVQRREFFF